MISSINKRKDDKRLSWVSGKPGMGLHQRDFQTQKISQMVLNEILQKAQKIKNRNFQVNHLVQFEKLKQSERFTANNSTEVLQNFFIKHQSLPQKMANENYLVSPSKSPYSFLKYEDISFETDRSNPAGQTWENRRNSTKIYNCNKIYILKKKNTKANTPDKNFSIKSIKLNDTLPSAFGRSSHKPQPNKVSVNHSIFVPRLQSHDKTTSNLLSSSVDYGTKNLFLQVTKNSIRPSFHDDENTNQKEEQQKTKLIKLQNIKKHKDSQKIDPKEKQTNQHIEILRQRKQKLQNIMKVFDLDDEQKKTHNIQRQNLFKQTKQENLAQTFSKMPSMTTDYQGNPLYFQDPFMKTQSNLQNSSKKKSYKRLPKYDTYEEGALSHNVNFKIKEIDDKTKNFLNQIFSSACGTPVRTSHKKITFNMKTLQTNRKINAKKNKKTQKNDSSKMSVNCEDKKQDSHKYQYQDLQNEPVELNHTKGVKNIYDNSKGLKSVLKLPFKTFRGDSQNSTSDKNKQNMPFEKTFGSSKNQGFLFNRQKTNITTEQSSQSNNMNKNSLKQLEAMYRQGYASHKQRIHPKLAKMKKTTISTEQNDFNKIAQSSNETTDRNHTQSEHRPLKKFFEGFIEGDTK